LVRQEIGATGFNGCELVAACANTAKSVRYDKELGYVCTLSALVIKSTTVHVLHVGDSRIYRLQGGALEQLTHDHRVWVSQEQSHLSRALGIGSQT